MLYKIKTLKDYTLCSLDGQIGKIKEFFFDDKHWTIRYLVVETTDWLMERQVLISPYVLNSVNTEERCITVDLTRKQIEDSPPLDTHQPVTRHFEVKYYTYYGLPTYWGGLNMWGANPTIVRGSKPNETATTMETEDFHLRSTLEVGGYNVQASDGGVGHIDDFIIDDESWAIRYLLVDTKNWRQGKKVLISPKWIERVSWEDSKVFVNLARDTIKLSPEFTEEALITRDYEADLHQFYHRDGYWVTQAATEHSAQK